MALDANLSLSASFRIFTRLLWFVLLATISANLFAEVSGSPSRTVGIDALDAKIEEVQATVGMDDAAKTKLVELYSKARTNLESVTADDTTTDRYKKDVEVAPLQTQTIREEIDNAQSRPPEDTLESVRDATLTRLEQLLQKEKADLAAVDARRADFEKRLEEEANRPEWIRQRLTEAKTQHGEVAAEMKLQPPADESPATSEAKRLFLETQYAALSAELRMLDQELLSQPMRVDLLKAKHDKAINSVEWVGRRVRYLEELISQKRTEEAERAQAQAKETRRQAEGEHPLIVSAAERNAILSDGLAAMAATLEQLTEDQALAEQFGRQIEEDYKSARETIEIAGLSQALGQVLQEQRQSLPEINTFRREAKERETQIAEVGLRRLRHREELKRLRDLDTYIDNLAQTDAAAAAGDVRPALRGLLNDRKQLLEKAIKVDELHLRQLGELDVAQRRLLDTADAYDDFLDEHLLWIRSTAEAQFDELGGLPGEARRFLSPIGWLGVVRVLIYQATHSPAFALVILVLGALLWKRRWMLDTIGSTCDRLGKPTTDRFGFTLWALALVLIAAAAWPLVLAAVGWQLSISLEGTSFSTAVAIASLAVAAQFYLMLVSRMICMPGGLADVHFLWPASSLMLLRRGLARLTWTFLPAAFVSVLAINLDPITLGGAIGRLSFVVMSLALSLFFFRVLNPKHGVLADFLRQTETRAFGWIHRFWFPLLVISPLALAVLALAGYLYTAGAMIANLLQTTWMVVGLIVLNELAMRWLLVTRRRLAYKAVMERQVAQQEAHESEESAADDRLPDVEEPDVDLVALSDDGRKLLNTAIIYAGIVGLWFIWLDVLPALRIFEQVSVWHQTVTVDGVDKRLPITLADVALGLVFAVGTVILTRRFPALLEIILIRRFDMPAGNRYTVITLTTYVIAATGIVLVFNTVGASWSKIQWLVAALSVGIGFGLQEIVANFISGLIILFERPIRVGDFVSVGDTDGSVTRIRSRATTIRTMDGKELLVPNKEFITGRLLNWSLSDPTIRLVIPVGVAYGSDVRRAMDLLREAAEEHEDVLDEPRPSVIFQGFGDNALTMMLRCFVDDVDLRYPTISALNEVINEKFNQAGIVIAFPQRDLHFDASGPLTVRLEQAGGVSCPLGMKGGAAGEDGKRSP